MLCTTLEATKVAGHPEEWPEDLLQGESADAKDLCEYRRTSARQRIGDDPPPPVIFSESVIGCLWPGAAVAASAREVCFLENRGRRFAWGSSRASSRHSPGKFSNDASYLGQGATLIL